MLFWLFLIVLIIGIGLFIVGNVSWDSEKHPFLWNNDCNIELVGEIVGVLSGLVIGIMIFILCGQYMGVDAYLEKNRETYMALTYKIESNSCRDEFGLLSKELIDEVQEWNQDVRYYQKIQRNFWVGIFYPNVYDEFETIDYERYVK